MPYPPEKKLMKPASFGVRLPHSKLAANHAANFWAKESVHESLSDIDNNRQFGFWNSRGPNGPRPDD